MPSQFTLETDPRVSSACETDLSKPGTDQSQFDLETDLWSQFGSETDLRSQFGAETDLRSQFGSVSSGLKLTFAGLVRGKKKKERPTRGS